MPPSKALAEKALSRFYRPSLEVLEDRTLLSFITAPTYAVGNSPQAMAVADFNHDGVPDLAVVNSGVSGTVSILLGKGDGSVPFAQKDAHGSGARIGDSEIELAVAVEVCYRHGGGRLCRTVKGGLQLHEH